MAQIVARPLPRSKRHKIRPNATRRQRGPAAGGVFRGSRLTERQRSDAIGPRLAGTWNCAHTVGDFSGTYVMSFAKDLGDRWLKQTWDFPATANRPRVHPKYFLGYDPRLPGWIRFGAHTNGQYYAMRTTSPGNERWSWQYVLPGTRGSVTWTKKSDAEYAIDGPEYPRNGKLATEHHLCKKLQ